MKRPPWMVPAILTASGIFHIYFRGMATPNRRMNDNPSKILTSLNLPNDVLSIKRNLRMNDKQNYDYLLYIGYHIEVFIENLPFVFLIFAYDTSGIRGHFKE